LPGRSLRLHFELEPGAPRSFISANNRSAVGLDRLDAPPVDRVAHPEVLPVAPPAPHADPSHEEVEESRRRHRKFA